MSAPEGNSQFCFPEILKNIAEMQGETQLRGGPLEIPGGGGGENSQKKFVQGKMLGKKFVQPLRQRKKKSCKQTAKYK
jgi:hypothetical protein